MKKKIVVVLLIILEAQVGISGETNKIILTTNEGPKLLINEIMFSTKYDWVEVYCVDDGNSGNGAQIKGFYFDDLDGDKDKVIGTCTIKTGEFLVLHYGVEEQDVTFGVNGKIDLFTNKKSITSTTDQLVIYNPLGEIIDAVCWTSDKPPENEESDRQKLIEVGKWQGEAIDSTQVSKGQSLARKILVDTNSKNDWYVTSVPTLGLPNEVISQATPSIKIKVMKIVNQTSCPQENKKPTIIYSLSEPAQVSLRIYDIRGRLVKKLIDQEYIFKEENTITWDGKNEDGSFLPVGIYICYLEAVNENGSSFDKATLILAKELQ